MDGPEYPIIHNLTINVKGVNKLLKKLKVQKSSVPDDLPTYILKELAVEIAPYT